MTYLQQLMLLYDVFTATDVTIWRIYSKWCYYMTYLQQLMTSVSACW